MGRRKDREPVRRAESFNFDSKEKIGPNELFLLGEPIIKHPPVEGYLRKFTITKGSEKWALDIAGRHYSEIAEEDATANEYLDIVQSLKNNGVDFRFIVAHDELIDVRFALAISQILGIRGAKWFKEIPSNLTSFPRDILFDYDGEIAVNPDANMQPQKDNMRISRMGEGGAVLKVSRKVLVADPHHYERDLKPSFEKGVREMRTRYKVGLMPWPIAVTIDTQQRTVKDVFPTPHIDRVSALIKGKDSKDYFIAEPSYADERVPGVGRYWQSIKQTCAAMNIVPEVVARKDFDAPCSLNLHQFQDGSVFMTKGHEGLERLVKQIVGEDKVFTTSKPIIIYPIVRQGGIRCMTLNVPKIMFKPQA